MPRPLKKCQYISEKAETPPSGGTMFSMTLGGAPCSKLVLLSLSSKQPLQVNTAYSLWNESGLRQFNFETLDRIIYTEAKVV